MSAAGSVGARDREERERKQLEAWLLKLLRDKKFDRVVSFVQANPKFARKVVAELRDPDFHWAPLLFAADGGSVQLLTALINVRAKLEVCDEEGNSSLSVAARQGHVEAVQLLGTRKANLNTQNRGGWTPLLWAAMNGHDAVATALLDLGASFTKVDALGRTSLMWAARHGHTAVADALLTRGVDFTRRDEEGLNAADHAQEHFELRASMVLAEERSRRLLEACQRNDVEAVRQTLEAGAGVDIPDDTGWPPLAWAMLLESRPLVEVLLQHGANPSLLGEEAQLGEQLMTKHTAVQEALHDVVLANERLLQAAKTSQVEVAEQALAAGAWINVQDEEERTPLMWAARRGAVPCLRLLLRQGALVNAQDKFGFTAVLYGAASRSVEAVSLLHHHNADVHARSHCGHTTLHLAVRSEDAAMVQVLLAAGADIDERDYWKRAPIHEAAANGQLSVLHCLIFCRADVHARDHEMRTPLALAVLEEQFTICDALLTGLRPPADPMDALKRKLGADEELQDEVISDGGLSDYEELEESHLGVSSCRGSVTSEAFTTTPRSTTPSRASDYTGPRLPDTSRSHWSDVTGPKQVLALLPPQPQPQLRVEAPEEADAGTAEEAEPWSQEQPLPEEAEPWSQEQPLPEEAEAEAEAAAAAPISPQGTLAEERAQPQKEAMKPGTKRKIKRVFVVASATMRMQAAVRNKTQKSGEGAKKKLSPEAKLRAKLLAKNKEPLGLVKAASVWRRQILEGESPPALPPPEELYEDEDFNGCCVLQLAARVPSKSIVRSLLTLNAEAGNIDHEENDVLMEAARSGDAEVVELLIKAGGADITHRNRYQQRAVDVASSVEAREVLEKAAVQSRVPVQLFQKPGSAGKKMGEQTAASAFPQPVIFRVRFEKLPRQLEAPTLRRQLRRLLHKLGAGRPLSLEVIVDPITERPKGIAYADFAEEDAAEAALAGSGQDFLDHEIAAVRDLPAAMVR